jgi:tetratricopeptide (TPR) repeat protein
MYFKDGGTEYFYSLLREAVESKAADAVSESEGGPGVNEGSILRSEVDKILSFIEPRLEKDTYQRLVLSIGMLMTYKGEYEIVEEIIESLLEHGDIDSRQINAEILLLQSKIAWNQNNWDTSENLCKKALSMFGKSGDMYGISNCENMLGNIEGEKGDIIKAEKHYLKGLDFAMNSSNLELKAMFNVNLGIISDMKGDIMYSEQYYSNALVFYKHLNNDFQVARLNHNLGMLSIKKEDYITSFRYFDSSINISNKKEFHSTYAISLASKAYAFAQIGEYDLANKFAGKAFEAAIRINDRLTIAEVYRVKGIVQKMLKNFTLAEEYLEISMQLNEDFSNEYNAAETSVDLAKLYAELNEMEKSSQMLSKAKDYYSKQHINEALITINN